MKKTIAHILRGGHSVTQTPLFALVNYLYPLKYILVAPGPTAISCNDNPFWGPSNLQRRLELAHDVMGMHGRSMKKGTYRAILDRFENGDGYGIVKDGFEPDKKEGQSDV